MPGCIIVTYMKVLRTLALLIGFAVFLNPIACATTKSNLPTSSVSPRDSFVKISFEHEGETFGGGSGVIVHHIENNTFILTAGHICDPLDKESYALDLDHNKTRVLILKVSEETDLCLMVTMDRIDRPISVIANTMPKPGEKAYNLAAPYGIHDKGMVLQFEGFYSGRITHPRLGYHLDMYTIPTRPGSSGSPVFNKNWEIIGIASMAFTGLENVGMMVPLEDIQEFLKDLWTA